MVEGRAGMRGVAGGVIVFDIVDEDGFGLRKRVPIMRICEDVEEPRPCAADRFRMTAKLLAGRVGDDAVLERDVTDDVRAVANAVNVVPRCEFKGAMIEDSILRLVKT